MSTPAAVTAAQLREAVTFHTRGQLAEAEARYHRVLQDAPRNFTALHMLGILHLQRGEPADAEAAFAKALKIEPRDPPALSNRGLALRALGRLDEALLCFAQSIAANPTSETHFNRGLTLRDLGRLDEALAAYDKALALKPDYADAHTDRGDALSATGRIDEALAAFESALRLRADDPRTLHNKACALQRGGRFPEACAIFRQAIALQPDFIAPQIGLGESLLIQGDFAQGWQAYGQWAAFAPEANLRSFPAPRWRGDADIAGKTLLLHADQGFGDTVQFCRYAPLVAARGARVIVEVQPQLAELVKSLSGAEVIARGDPLPPFDFHIPLMSLAAAFGSDLQTIPAAVSYLSADPGRAAHWRSRLAGTDALHVGVVWSGSARHRNDRFRSIPLDIFAPLLARVDVDFVSLQAEMNAADQKRIAALPGLMAWGNELKDFNDTAALIAALDLVITVDTSVAHVAAALGKPVWVLLSYSPDWRWLLNRSDSPWYPTARLFRQPAPGAWAEVVAEVARALSRKAAHKERISTGTQTV